MKTAAAKLPQLTAEMTRPQFYKFKTHWNVYKHITNPTTLNNIPIFTTVVMIMYKPVLSTPLLILWHYQKINYLPPKKILLHNCKIQLSTTSNLAPLPNQIMNPSKTLLYILNHQSLTEFTLPTMSLQSPGHSSQRPTC